TPREVGSSLRRRNGISQALALKLWLTYNQSILAATSSEDRIVTHFETNFLAPECELRRILSALGASPAAEQIAHGCTLLKVDRRHSRYSAKDLAECAPEIRSMYTRLCEEARFAEHATVVPRMHDDALTPMELPENALFRTELAEIRAQQMGDRRRIAELREMLLDAHDQLAQRDNRIVFGQLGRDVNDLIAFLDTLERELTATYASRRWRLADWMTNLGRLLTGRSKVAGRSATDRVFASYHRWRTRRSIRDDTAGN